MKKLALLGLGTAGLVAAAVGLPSAANATIGDTFNFTSCTIGGCPNPGGPYGTVSLEQVGANINVDVTLAPNFRFVETGAGGGDLFDFNDALPGSTVSVSSIQAFFNGAPVTLAGGFSGGTNASIHTGGDGTFSGDVACSNAGDCPGGSTPNINQIRFTITNDTLAQLEVVNTGQNGGHEFVADVACGLSTCNPGANTGLIDVTPFSAVPGPVVGAGLPGLIVACIGLLALGRRRLQKVV